jgi:tRNA(His) 5'-end guanylyltransferase
MMNADTFESQQQQREWFHSLTVPVCMWTVLRVDGRGFSKLTEASYTKPFDEKFADHMLATAAGQRPDSSAGNHIVESPW